MHLQFLKFKILTIQDTICIANREGKTVECLGAGLHSPEFLGQTSNSISDIGRVYAIAARGTALLAVNGAGSYYDPPTRVKMMASMDSFKYALF